MKYSLLFILTLSLIYNIAAAENPGRNNSNPGQKIKTPPAVSGLTNGLAAYYPFNGNANDESGNGNHGTVYGAALTEDRFGAYESAMRFFGPDMNYILINNSPSLMFSTNAISISVWVNVEQFFYWDTTRFVPVLSKEVNDKDNILETPDYEILSVNDSLGFWPVGTLHYNFQLNRWVHICVVWDGGTLSLYENGNLAASRAVQFTMAYTLSNLHLGANLHLGDEYLTGKLDDIRIYSRALSPEEVDSLYHEGGWMQEIIRVESPNGGEEWLAGAPQQITWSSTNVDNVKIEFTTNGGQEWRVISDNVPADRRAYEWTADSASSDECKIKISSVEKPSVFDESDSLFSIVLPAGLDESEVTITGKSALYQNSPNPVTNSTRIRYTVPMNNDQRSMIKVVLKVYDLLGREIAVLADEEKSPGEYEVEFNAAGLPSGVYMYRLTSGRNVEANKMILIR
ncbi:MAG: T9SS type A sorting domain-containing protein [Ignavibacteriaceae bacterium]|nr:T9SS type A sorting domain-containing protein [Ignavibacteriaceae bacterium]